MSDTRQHHHVTLVPRADQVQAARVLLTECAERVAAQKAVNGPTSWCAAWDEETKAFIVEAVFPSEEAVQFHQANIKDLLGSFGPMMAAKPETVIRRLFASV